MTPWVIQCSVVIPGVATLAGTAFGAFGEDYLRISYANSLEAIGEAVERIRRSLGNQPSSDAA